MKLFGWARVELTKMRSSTVQDGLFLSGLLFFSSRIGGLGRDTWKIQTSTPTDQYQFQNTNYLLCNRVIYHTPTEHKAQWAIRPVQVFVNGKQIH